MSRTPTAGTRTRVLLAEDDADLRDLLAAALEQDGLEVAALPDGAALVEEGERFDDGDHRVDLVLTDHRMPKVDGLAAARRLRQAGLQSPVVLLTAFPDERIHREARAHGVEVLAKPSSVHRILHVVRAALAPQGCGLGR